jgi:hypothetical protein
MSGVGLIRKWWWALGLAVAALAVAIWWPLGIALAVLVVAMYVVKELAWTDYYWLWRSRSAFVAYPIPLKATQLLMDVGIVDADGNDVLDVYTTNHNYRQDLLIGDGNGKYRDVLSEWGLDQNHEFPGLEIDRDKLDVSAAGLYIYWKGADTVAIRSVGMRGLGPVRGTVRTYTKITSYKADGIDVEAPVVAPRAEGKMSETSMEFSAAADGTFDLEIESPGVPIGLVLGASFPLNAVYVGMRKVSPRSSSFELTFRDRHGMAWADYNDDGHMDVFISRGALGGTLLALPDSIAKGLQDEFVVSQGPGRFRDIVGEVGIEKRGCSGRKATWVDYNRDGRIDLFINCQDRGRVNASYAKHLYCQGPDKRFTDVAAEVGLAIAEHEVIDFVWFDADNDGYVDLLTYEDTGFYLYRNQAGKLFSREFIGRGKFARVDNPKLRGTVSEYWFVDGKLSVADIKGDGNLHVFCSSKTGNILLVNDGSGRFALVDPTTLGLPAASAAAGWVDYDNDGLVDLYAVPQGLFRQRRDHSFEATGLLALPPRKYMAAIVNWADFDNDGRRDMLLALNQNFALWRWWEKLGKTSEDRFAWKFLTYRNIVSNDNHWLQLRLVGKPGNAQAIGARVAIQTPDGRQTQQVGLNDGAFFSQGHYRLYFGLGKHPRADLMTIHWPDGEVREFKGVEGDRLQVIRQAEPEGTRGGQ